MAKPKLTWYTKLIEDTEYEAGQRFYAGTYMGDDPIMLQIHLWNNRYGEKDVDDLTNFELEFYFDKEEDSALIDCCSVSITGQEDTSIKKIGNRGIIQLSNALTISGKANDGEPDKDTSNYLPLTFTFSAPNLNLKEHDLKSLFMEVVTH